MGAHHACVGKRSKTELKRSANGAQTELKRSANGAYYVISRRFENHGKQRSKTERFCTQFGVSLEKTEQNGTETKQNGGHVCRQCGNTQGNANRNGAQRSASAELYEDSSSYLRNPDK